MLKLRRQVFRLASAHLLEMRAHLSSCLPDEGCGIISGKAVDEGWHALRVFPVTNELRSPTRFRMAPQEQWAVFQAIENLHESLVGIYHSHPVGPPEPSEIDLQEFSYPGVPYLIWSQENNLWGVRAFLLEDRHVGEIRIAAGP